MRRQVKHILAKVALGVNQRKRRKGGCLILMLHKINDLPDPLPLTLSPACFERMIEEILEVNQIVGLDESPWLTADQPNGGLKFAITFDDGYRDNFEQALPIMERLNVPATLYVSVDHVDGTRVFWYERLISAIRETTIRQLDLTAHGLGSYSLARESGKLEAIRALNLALKRFDVETRDGYICIIEEALRSGEARKTSSMLTWEMIRTMADRGVTIGSHTMSHPILSRETPERVRAELRESKARLEGTLGKPVSGFAYPNGTYDDFTPEVVEELKRSGYQHAVTTMPGVNTAGADPFVLKRIEVHNRMCCDTQGNFSGALFWANVLGMFKGYWA